MSKPAKVKKIFWRTFIGLATIYAVFTLIRDWPVYKELYHNITTSSFERSIAAHTEAIRQNPRDPSHYATRAMIYTWAKKYDEAIADHLKSLEVDKNYDFYALDDLSALYLLKGDTLKAREYLSKAKRIVPYPEKLLYHEALIDDFEGKSQAAFQAYGEYSRLIDLTKKPKARIILLKRRLANSIKLGNYRPDNADIAQLQKELPNEKEVAYILSISDQKDLFNSVRVQNFLKLDIYEALVEPSKTE